MDNVILLYLSTFFCFYKSISAILVSNFVIMCLQYHIYYLYSFYTFEIHPLDFVFAILSLCTLRKLMNSLSAFALKTLVCNDEITLSQASSPQEGKALMKISIPKESSAAVIIKRN